MSCYFCIQNLFLNHLVAAVAVGECPNYISHTSLLTFTVGLLFVSVVLIKNVYFKYFFSFNFDVAIFSCYESYKADFCDKKMIESRLIKTVKSIQLVFN